ncbi:MAG: ATP-dependent Clp protease proteolytic subunit [Bacteroidota bacterium]
MNHDFLHYATRHHGLSRMHLETYAARSTSHISAQISPMIIEERSLNIAQLDVFSRLMMDRIIFLGVPINDYVANVIQAQLLFLHSTDAKRDVQLFINSPGGSVTAGLGIYDTMQYIGPDVATICTSLSASMSAVLLASGAKGKRSALPHARVMIHQPSGGMQGQVADMEISYRLVKSLQKQLYTILSEHTGQDYATIEADSDRDNWMEAEAARDYGLIDEVLTR